MKRVSLLLIASIAFISVFAQNIDSERSQVSFEVSNMYVNSVEGEFKDVSGSLNLNAASGEDFMDICLEVSTINTGNEKRDDHLRNEDFFDVSKYPRICYRASTLIKQEDGSYLASGIMSMHGVEKELEIPIKIENSKLTCSFEVDRMDFEVGSDYGAFTVGKTVTLDVDIALFKD